MHFSLPPNNSIKHLNEFTQELGRQVIILQGLKGHLGFSSKISEVKVMAPFKMQCYKSAGIPLAASEYWP